MALLAQQAGLLPCLCQATGQPLRDKPVLPGEELTVQQLLSFSFFLRNKEIFNTVTFHYPMPLALSSMVNYGLDS